MIGLFEKVKDIDHPVLLHIHTIKGKGFKFAEENREKFHAGGPFHLETGEYISAGGNQVTYNSNDGLFIRKMATDPKVVAVNAGTPMLLFSRTTRKSRQTICRCGYCRRACGIDGCWVSKNGAKPVWAVFLPLCNVVLIKFPTIWP